MEALNNDDISHKGKKIQKYSLDLKKQVIAFAEEHGNRPASRHFKVDEREYRNGDRKRAKSCNSLRRRKENKEVN